MVNIEMIWSYVYTLLTKSEITNAHINNSDELSKENKLIGYRIWKWGWSTPHSQIL